MSLFTVCLRTIAGFYAVACEVLPCSSLFGGGRMNQQVGGMFGIAFAGDYADFFP